MMQDVLKNNLLKGAAITLVRSVNDIDDICKRLKPAHGDSNLLFKKRISQLSKISELWKWKDPEKLVDAIGRIISTMKDLQQLASEHHIQSRL